MDIIRINPENLEVANAYIQCGSLQETADKLNLPVDTVSSIIETAEIKGYINSMFMDLGYRNKFKLGNLLDTLIDKKLEEAAETELYTKKDLAELIELSIKMRDTELKHNDTPKTQVNIQNNTTFGEGNYGKLMEKLLCETP